MDIEISGVDAIVADFTKFAAEMLPAVRVVTQKTCADTKADAQALSPVDTGFLRASIGYETKALATAVVGEVGPTAAYGEYVEDGTSRMSPQPYMGPAFDRRAPEFEAALGLVADRLLR